VHGHAHPAIVDAAVQAVVDGASYGLPNFNELRHASALLSRTSHLDQVRYTNSGTEAVMTAVRVARAHTRRDGCIFVNATYHGTADSALAPGGPLTRRGVPRGVLDDVVVLPINDVDALVAAVEKHPQRFAAMVLDLLPNRAGLVPLTPEYVEAAEHMRAQHGVLLVIDEVISFRQDWRGLAGQYGMTPDLMTLGKLIGGGHPIGAVLGREAVMSELDPLRPDGLEHGGTFTGNPVTMAAGLATMELFDVDAVSRLNGLGRRIRDGLRVVVEDLGWEVRGSGSLFRLHPGPTATEPVPVLQRALWWEALRREVLTAPNGLASLSTPMDEAVVDEVVGRLADALRAVVDASGARAAGTVA
jgi:glutamate-1-semialdehyde 2,1-aminomutase